MKFLEMPLCLFSIVSKKLEHMSRKTVHRKGGQKRKKPQSKPAIVGETKSDAANIPWPVDKGFQAFLPLHTHYLAQQRIKKKNQK